MQPFQCYVPKNHLMLHLLKDSDSCGNPCEYATWVDEALNNTLKGACRSASQLAFESSLILERKQNTLTVTIVIISTMFVHSLATFEFVIMVYGF